MIAFGVATMCSGCSTATPLAFTRPSSTALTKSLRRSASLSFVPDALFSCNRARCGWSCRRRSCRRSFSRRIEPVPCTAASPAPTTMFVVRVAASHEVCAGATLVFRDSSARRGSRRRVLWHLCENSPQGEQATYHSHHCDTRTPAHWGNQSAGAWLISSCAVRFGGHGAAGQGVRRLQVHPVSQGLLHQDGLVQGAAR
jgi:hypothetical protein